MRNISMLKVAIPKRILTKMSLYLRLAIIFAFIGAGLCQECAPVTERIDCHPDGGATEARCLARGCLWCPVQAGIPSCVLKSSHGYNMESLLPDENGYRVLLKRASIDSSYFGNDFDLLTATVTFESDYRLRIKIVPDGENRYEVPLQVSPPASPPTPNAQYAVDFLNDPVFGFQVKRRSSGAVIFDTTLGGLTFSDQYIQLGIRLPSTNVYGIGENEQHTFRQNFSNYESYPLFARDAAPDGTTNIYGVQPYYTVVEEDGNVHSVMIVNSNAQEFVKIPAPGYVYRTIGGILDIYIFLGPGPEEVVHQFTEAVGRTAIPPYWALGFHLCRHGYDTIENMRAAVERTTRYGIPLDVQYGDIDIMDRRLDFTYNTTTFHGLPDFIEELHQAGMKFVTILDPAISAIEPDYETLELGNEMDVWVKRPDGTPFVGTVWPEGPAYFPDYSRNSTREWWIYLIVKFHDLLDWDALWIDMNEPTNFHFGDIEQGCRASSNLNFPPYVPPIKGGELPDATICMDTQQDFGVHYDTHNLYGWSESEPTLAGVRAALPGKRSFVLTRSTFVGVQRWASHWLGDNHAAWEDMHYSIIGILQFNQFGLPYVGPDICGHYFDISMEMCTRWQQIGAFYPYSRNHNTRGTMDKDPGNFGEFSANSSRRALLIRYTLLPYLYTLFYQHIKFGSTVARPLWHTFPHDQVALGVDRQFMWGDGILISPVLQPAAITVSAYFPHSRWYSYYDGQEITNTGQYVTLGAPLDYINVHVHGGRIIPTQEPAVNTELSKLNPFGLIVALDETNQASGSLYVDDGNSVDPQISGEYFEAEYSVTSQNLRMEKVHEGYDVSSKLLDTVRIFGHGRAATQVTVNGSPHTNYTNNPESGEITIQALNLALNADLVIGWVG